MAAGIWAWFGSLRAKVQPPEIPVFHVSPRSCQRSLSIFPTVFATMVDQTETLSLPLIPPYILGS